MTTTLRRTIASLLLAVLLAPVAARASEDDTSEVAAGQRAGGATMIAFGVVNLLAVPALVALNRYGNGNIGDCYHGRANDDGCTMDAAIGGIGSIAAGVSGALLLAVGIPLLVHGQRLAREHALTLVPTASPTGGTLTLIGRF